MIKMEKERKEKDNMINRLENKQRRMKAEINTRNNINKIKTMQTEKKKTNNGLKYDVIISSWLTSETVHNKQELYVITRPLRIY